MIAPWYVMAYVGLERVAWRHGYCLALHGSMARDLDVIAIPWTEDADSPERLLVAFKRFIVSKAPVNIKGKHKGTLKPHGRIGYVLPIGYDGHYIDLSIMPLADAPTVRSPQNGPSSEGKRGGEEVAG